MTATPPAAFLADTSAWIEFLRATQTPLDAALRDGLVETDRVSTAGIIVEEVLAGCRDERHANRVRRLLGSCRVLAPVDIGTYEHAAALFRRCRGQGRAVRGTVDCLVAAIALEHDATVLGRDRDLVTLRDVCGLRLWP